VAVVVVSVGLQVDEIFPILKHVKGLLLKIHWRSVDLVPALEHPMLFISGGQDRLVPPAMLRRLHDAAVRSTSRELYVVEDADHNDTFVKGAYKRAAAAAGLAVACCLHACSP